MAEKRDYYEVLGLQKGADIPAIKKAFHEMAKKYHPDLHPGDKAAEEKFKEINEAYAVLSDPEKKSMYDQYGHAAFEQQTGGGPGPEGFTGGFNFDDILNMFTGGFGGGSASRDPYASGEDIHAQMDITLEELAQGVEKDITYTRRCLCKTCNGTGAKPGTRVETCSKCHGSGRIRTRRQSLLGFVDSVAPCDACGGRGKKISTPCEKCKGSGLVKEPTKVHIKLPGGFDVTREHQVNRSMGHAGKDGSYGELYLSVRVLPHKVFEWQGQDLFCTVPITVTDAILGGEIDVPTITGETTKFKLPEGTQHGDRFSISGMGLPNMYNKDRKGRLIFTVQIEIPKNLKEDQKQKIREFSELCGEGNYQKKSSFFKTLKDKFNKKKTGND
ncbi:MAG: molecular chaperone DnaJ [Clostridia bacterium]|nr:molecular chaperone DnaJ [Clostridia bacterium]